MPHPSEVLSPRWAPPLPPPEEPSAAAPLPRPRQNRWEAYSPGSSTPPASPWGIVADPGEDPSSDMEVEPTAEAPKPAGPLKFWESAGPASSVLAPLEDAEEPPAPLPDPPADKSGGSDAAAVEEEDSREASELPPLPSTPEESGEGTPPPPPPTHFQPAELHAASLQQLVPYSSPGYHPDPCSPALQGATHYGLQPTEYGHPQPVGQLHPVADLIPPWHNPEPTVQSIGDVSWNRVGAGGQPISAVAGAGQSLQSLVPPLAWSMKTLGQAANQVQ